MKIKLIMVSFAAILLLSIVTTVNAWAMASDDTSADYLDLSNQLNQMLAQEKGTYGIFVLDLNSGKTLGMNSLEPFHAASTFKLPLNFYLYRQISQGLVHPDEVLTYQQGHYEGGTGRLQFEPVGSSYNIRTLSRYSIVYSDNVATNMLLAHLGRKNVKDFMRSLGGQVVDDQKNITCPRDMAVYMHELLLFASAQPEPAGQLIHNLENTVYNERIPKLLPEGLKIAHKIGNWPPTGTYNDVGYVPHPVNPYIISIYSKGTAGSASAFRVIQRISKSVYDYQNRFLPVTITVNNEVLPASPYLNRSIAMAPVRELSEALGAQVQWEETSKTVTIAKEDTVITLKIGDTHAFVNGTVQPLNISSDIVNGKTMVPVRFICETLGAGIQWSGESSTISITLDTMVNTPANSEQEETCVPANT